MRHEPPWLVESCRATAAELHDDWPPVESREHRRALFCEVVGPALVLGSAQRGDAVDDEAVRRQAVAVVRRHSGGGAVLVAPMEQIWLDVWIPRQDPLWVEDIVVAPQWLGELWRDALVGTAADGQALSVHRGRMERRPWSDVVCFSGVGPGEVSFGGRKLVGISQRRTRAGARLSSMALLVWDPAPLVGLLALDDTSRRAATHDTADVACGLVDVLGSRVDSSSLLPTLTQALRTRLGVSG